AEHGPGPAHGTPTDRGRSAESHRSAVGVSLSNALRVRDAAVRRCRSAAGGGGGRARRRVLSVRGCDGRHRLTAALSCHSPRGGASHMRRIAPPTLQHTGVDRRRFLGITSIATATTLLGVTTSFRLGYAAALTKEQRDKLTPDDIIALMKKGNERFRLGQESPHDYLAQQKATVAGQ